ncbi:uncharacterized protein L969DRAFT_85265 [Mixia osmundae IAM 14324]|uniref:THIF-type NAD/FAD binding fold domain-containing protein n=1 Tax=Mixia osmundae (strain CBS 9802 / IAM 14324 / JCM 22182 / KY 12970) TaxID=764103 RepID=G7DYC2_MIXOS|nr:uncharacterized protein L969DRAFT_85265 [Mixia osmundae IAM 14324]KEI41485.1 hypothetical protein L969DRAFT_85265 [Mixia osmundae IAM 14324]GAA95582.1 hypothetical protein E5Q_02238 [Mixia osmundae IAM 14324]
MTWGDRLAALLTSSAGKAIILASFASLGTATLILGTQDVRRRAYRRTLRQEVEEEVREQPLDTLDLLIDSKQVSGRTTPARRATPLQQEDENDTAREMDQAIIDEHLARNYAFMGKEGVQRVRDAFVIVVGLGGVGSAAALMLARSGVGRIRLIDFDQCTLSSLNRHATATLADVGLPKVKACQRAFRAIAPWVRIDARVELFRMQDADILLAGDPDWVIDAIDNVETKIDLLTYCHHKGIKVFASMGAASKADPSRVQIADISATDEDPLARAVRKKLRTRGISQGIPVVYSTERPNPDTALVPLDEEVYQAGKVTELSALEAFRVRILPVLGPIPAMFGQAIAAHVLTSLAGMTTAPLATRLRPKAYQKLSKEMYATDERLFGSSPRMMSDEDVAYMYEEVFNGRSAIAPLHLIPQRPLCLRWHADAPLSRSNFAVFEASEAQTHMSRVLQGGETPEQVWGKQTADMIQARFSNDERLRRWLEV